jgi:ABC-type transport system involved in multi-copper enzyme maturation permease subunit
VLLLCVSGLVALFVSLGIAFNEGGWQDQDVADLFSVPGGVTSVFAVLVGLAGFTGEFRHGTIAQTFLVTPRRERVLAAKIVAWGLVGLAFAVVTEALMLAIAVPWLHADGVHIPGSTVRAILLGGLAGGALWAALGVAVGGAVRNQVGAVIGALVWLFVIENILFGFFPEKAKFLPGRAGDALHGSGIDHELTRGQGGLVLLGWVALATVVAAFLLRERDVT